ncbi:UNVERIFIED_CONTAM: hypothetical protein Sradi_2430500 [Sesamum radiatum]|uniref:B30.2/SPRY domain-containing protein n=1 Tax=Sesamum radiatum TaxID=300843 RepID=A0AAW2SJ13_SESRA
MKISWLHVILAAASVVILVLLLLLILHVFFVVADTERGQSLETAISRLHQVRPHHDNLDGDDSKETSFDVSRHGVVPAEVPIFSWAENPSLVTDAVENGWPRFAFTTLLSAPVKSARSLVGVCAGGGGHHGNGINVGIGWDVCEGSADYMQKIRLNPGLKKEAYFEITILPGGGPLPLKFPGSYPGSIGFNSSGSVYLEGAKLVSESEKAEWGRAEKVIGCGYNPAQKKVLFTVDSQLVHEVHCKTEEFGCPLYPTLAANADVVVVVNLGQSPFRFAPGNLQRTPNPCFIRPQHPNSPALGYEDSKELFSMGRIDSQWLKRSGTIRSCNYTGNSIKGMEFELESEGDLFEIVLDIIRDDLRGNSNPDQI